MKRLHRQLSVLHTRGEACGSPTEAAAAPVRHSTHMEDPGVHPWAEWQRRGVTRSVLRQGLRNGRFTQVNHGRHARLRRSRRDPGGEKRRRTQLSAGSRSPQRLDPAPPSEAARPRRSSGPRCPPWPLLPTVRQARAGVGGHRRSADRSRHALRCLDPEGITVVCDSLLNTSLRAMSGEPIAEILTPTEVESAFQGAPGYIRHCSTSAMLARPRAPRRWSGCDCAASASRWICRWRSPRWVMSICWPAIG